MPATRRRASMITRLRITIEPERDEASVEVIVDGVKHTTVARIEVDDFESRFDWFMEKSRLEILRLVKAHGKLRK